MDWKTAADEELPVTKKELALPPKADTEKSPLLKKEKEQQKRRQRKRKTRNLRKRKNRVNN